MEYAGETYASYVPDGARQLYQSAKGNAFLSALPAEDFSLLAPTCEPYLSNAALLCTTWVTRPGTSIFPKAAWFLW